MFIIHKNLEFNLNPWSLSLSAILYRSNVEYSSLMKGISKATPSNMPYSPISVRCELNFYQVRLILVHLH
jgi:hypothetical protein